jgi:predicted membrane-bound spermidine synthase
MQQVIQEQKMVMPSINNDTLKCIEKVSVWKRALSYFYPVKIECASSSFNPKLDVYLKQGRYQLCTPNAVYSYGDLYDNFTRTFDAMELDILDVRKVLVLGFGMGSITTILEKVFEKHYDYTGVEIDQKIIELARKYVLSDMESAINLICDDAFNFVKECNDQFDLIAVDLFIDDKVPLAFEQKDFLQSVKKLLNDDGVLLYNRLSFNKRDLIDTKQFFAGQFTDVFPNSTYLDVDGNWMLLNRDDIIKG